MSTYPLTLWLCTPLFDGYDAGEQGTGRPAKSGLSPEVCRTSSSPSTTLGFRNVRSLPETKRTPNVFAVIGGSLPDRCEVPRYDNSTRDILPVFPMGRVVPAIGMEAVSLSLPVIATRASSISELVSEGVSGLLISRGDENALAENIVGLASDERVRRQMGEERRKRVEAILDMRRTSALYRQCCGITDHQSERAEAHKRVHKQNSCKLQTHGEFPTGPFRRLDFHHLFTIQHLDEGHHHSEEHVQG